MLNFSYAQLGSLLKHKTYNQFPSVVIVLEVITFARPGCSAEHKTFSSSIYLGGKFISF